MAEWKFKKDAAPVFCSDDFWYSLAASGRIKPEALLESDGQIARLEAAIALVSDFEEAACDAGVIEFN